MRNALILVFSGVFLTMLALTVAASLEQGVFEAGRDLWPDPWFRATLADAYFGFLTVWLWVAWRERSWIARLSWLILFLALGNFAIAAYVILRLVRLRPGDGVERLLLRDGT